METNSETLKKFLANFAVVKNIKIQDEVMPAWLSKIDNSFICFVDNEIESTAMFLYKNNICQHVQGTPRQSRTAQIGFNPEKHVWWGWSHRAGYGFGVGSKCTIGNVHFNPSNPVELRKKIEGRMKSEEYLESFEIHRIKEFGQWGYLLTRKFTDQVPNPGMKNSIQREFIPYPESWGRGEWEATNLEDARQMAIDFANNIA